MFSEAETNQSFENIWPWQAEDIIRLMRRERKYRKIYLKSNFFSFKKKQRFIRVLKTYGLGQPDSVRLTEFQ